MLKKRDPLLEIIGWLVAGEAIEGLTSGTGTGVLLLVVLVVLAIYLFYIWAPVATWRWFRSKRKVGDRERPAVALFTVTGARGST